MPALVATSGHFRIRIWGWIWNSMTAGRSGLFYWEGDFTYGQNVHNPAWLGDSETTRPSILISEGWWNGGHTGSWIDRSTGTSPYDANDNPIIPTNTYLGYNVNAKNAGTMWVYSFTIAPNVRRRIEFRARIMTNRHFWMAVIATGLLLMGGSCMMGDSRSANLTIVDPTCAGWTFANDIATCTATPTPPTPPVPPPVQACAGFQNVLSTTATWGQAASWKSSSYGAFGSGATTVWMFTMTVPAGTPASTVVGRFAISEYQAQATFRQMTISSTPCDFRKVDHTGAAGPLAVSNGTTATISYAVGGSGGLVAGQTYYISARNWQLDPTPQNSCQQASCNALMKLSPATP